MKKIFVLLAVLAMVGSACASVIVQSYLDTTPVKLSGDGDVALMASSPGLYSGGGFYVSPSGEDYYLLAQGQSYVAEYRFDINTIIPDGTYTAEVTWGTTGFIGDLMAMNVVASADALTNGRISFTGGSAHEMHTGFPTDKPGWWTETIIGPAPWFTGIYFNRVPYESVTINGMQAGDLSFVLSDLSAASYRRISWDTLEFTIVPEPATIALLGLGGIALLRRKK